MRGQDPSEMCGATGSRDNDFKTAEAGEEASLPANESRGTEENVHRS